MSGQRQHLDRDDGCIRSIDLAFDTIERLADATLTRGECEFAKIRAVPESSLSAGGRLHDGRGCPAVHGFEVVAECRWGSPARGECRPMLHEPTQDQWL